MIDYKNQPESEPTLPATPADGTVSLTWLWEVIVRTKRLPDDFDPKVLFVVLRDRLRNPEREVRQHALRVLADLVPAIDQNTLDNHMETLLPELIVNLSYMAPAVRKGAVDVFRIYLKHTPRPNDILRTIMTAVSDDSHLMLGLIMATSYFVIKQINEDTLAFLLRQLVVALNQDFLRETSLNSMIKIRRKLGKDKFNVLLGTEATKEFEMLCEARNVNLDEDNVIMETEITLETGPAITMKIHEENSAGNSYTDSEDGQRLRMTDSDSESAMRSPRKVRFGGEVVKMRTPESDSNQPSDDNDMQTSVVIDRPTSIRITLGDGVAAIKTRHKSMIPVRITTGGSNPSTPRKRVRGKKRLHQSAPELRGIQVSKIPQLSWKKEDRREEHHKREKREAKLEKKNNKPTIEKKPPAKTTPSGRTSRNSNPGRNSRSVSPKVYSPIPVHHEIQILHNLSRSPSRSPERTPDTSVRSPTPKLTDNKNNPEERAAVPYNSFQVVTNNENANISPKESPKDVQELKYNSFLLYDHAEDAKTNESSGKIETKSNNFLLPPKPVVVNKERVKTPEPNTQAEQKVRDQNMQGQRTEDKKTHSGKAKSQKPQESLNEIIEAHLNEENKNESATQTYGSFEICQEDEEMEDKSTIGILDIIIQDLIHKEDNWSKSIHLDDLITFLHQNSFPLPSTLNYPSLLRALFLCERQPRLQTRAQEALRLYISTVHVQALQNTSDILGSSLVRMGAPTGVRLALLAMQRNSPKKFLDCLKAESATKEGVLQMWIAAARTFPSSEIDVVRGTKLAYEALKDRRRAVRQAALETLASLAQVAGNGPILETVISASETSSEESETLLRIIRTRLSRKQLPSVDFNGNVRYSSPREQEEFDWLCGSPAHSKSTKSLSSMKVQQGSNSNYWKHNLRHEFEDGDNSMIVNVSSIDESNNNKDQIWAVNGSKVSIEKAALCPVYVLQQNPHSKSYRNYDRGRSNSPPPSRRSEGHGGKGSKKSFRQNEQFRKSFSSEQIYNGNHKNPDPTSFSLSSRSSTTSTGSSTKSGLWLKSGIPVPVTSDSKLKLRTARHSSDTFAGPLLAQEGINRTKIESAKSTPTLFRPGSQLVLNPNPPLSSGSETSGYFTPPAEHHLKDSAVERIPPESSFEENNNVSIELEEPNFQVVQDSEVSDDQEINERPSSNSSNDVNGDQRAKSRLDQDVVDGTSQRYSPLEGLDFNENPRTFVEPRSKSRTEGNNLRTSLPDITDRKIVNSAPVMNEIVPYRFAESPHQLQEMSPVKMPLPGCISSSENTPTKQVVPTMESPAKRLTLRRTMSTRNSSKTRAKSPGNPDVRPYTRPKEALQQGLAQMDSGDWESIIQGLNCLIRLARNHPDLLELQMHPVCVSLAKSIRNLRSQVARTACHACSEIFVMCRRGLEMELEELATPLLQRTADTNRFIRSDANAALDAMSLNLSIPRVVAVITSKGSTHQNCVVRAASTRLLCDIAHRIGPDKVYQLPKETRDKILLVGANGLTEGSLDTRRHAKSLMSALSKHPQFKRALSDAVPQHTMRHIAKAISSLN